MVIPIHTIFNSPNIFDVVEQFQMQETS